MKSEQDETSTTNTKDKTTKKPYETPKLTKHEGLVEITRQLGPPFTEMPKDR